MDRLMLTLRIASNGMSLIYMNGLCQTCVIHGHGYCVPAYTDAVLVDRSCGEN
jgi:hypothetical protein